MPLFENQPSKVPTLVGTIEILMETFAVGDLRNCTRGLIRWNFMRDGLVAYVLGLANE